MPRSAQYKLKPFYLMRILEENTDADNPLTISEIIAKLAAYDVMAERKSIYTDLELLRQFGVDIETSRDKTTRYYIANRRFELPELKLLVDAVQSSRFITGKKSEELISKLSALTSEAQAGQLERQVYLSGRPKAVNESLYYNVDAVHSAINAERQIQFRYFDYNIRKRRVYRKNGGTYQCTPVALCWNDDQYYLIAYSAKHDGLAHYRVDRMSDVTMLEAAAEDFDRKNFDAAGYAKKLFGMYSGETVSATLSFDTSLVSVVFDHFGTDVQMRNTSDGRFTVTVDVSASPVFFGWMLQFGERAKIDGPASLVAAIRELIEANERQYR